MLVWSLLDNRGRCGVIFYLGFLPLSPMDLFSLRGFSGCKKSLLWISGHRNMCLVLDLVFNTLCLKRNHLSGFTEIGIDPGLLKCAQIPPLKQGSSESHWIVSVGWRHNLNLFFIHFLIEIIAFCLNVLKILFSGRCFSTSLHLFCLLCVPTSLHFL